ncbi:sn-glycerol-3-phosphate ABC transporter ATP-binding protein UgpC [Candidatus Marinimicrobia bacterium MT.SAG.3]|nr:sn-glycerol-3-phosphate ABC transporter ATP-binding protein UgpC [Candidatus Marinimicrobia bacterium MT.SAG.3]
MAQVALKNISKEFEKGVFGIKDANIDIADGEFVVLVGPSGCGKSTTLRIIAGLEEATSGNVFIGDKDVSDVAPKDRDIAMVFQNYALYPHMDVYENISFGLKLRKYDPEEIKRRVKDAAEILDITHLLGRKPKALSGGQRQRVALGRAIVRQPSVFLFDEPLSNLDAKLRVQMRTEISKLHNRLKTTMIYVTHDQVEAMTLGDRIIVMKDSFILQTDTPLNLYNNPINKFVAGFIGSPSMNFIKGKFLNGNGFTLDDGSVIIKLDGNLPDKISSFVNKEIIMGIRPEDVSLSPSNGGIPMTIEVSEMMGNEIYLYMTTGSNSIVSRVPPNAKVEEGNSVDVDFDLSKAHYFDPETEEKI